MSKRQRLFRIAMDGITGTRGLVCAAYAVVLVCASSLPVPVHANSVWYEVDLWAGNASGTLNGKHFSNADIQLDFFGDTSTVLPYSVANPTPPGGKTSGYVNLTSTSATFGIYSFNPSTGTYTTVGTGTFEPSARIYVSVDNTNGGIGFGSFGVKPGQAGFPGQPVYPGSILVPACCVTPNVTKYDLKSTFFVDAYQISCWGFPGTCRTGNALATTAGPLVLNQITVGTPGDFNAQVFQYAAVQPMTSLSASVAVQPLTSGPTGASGLHRFSVQGTFQLGDGAEGVDPATQDVVLRLGTAEFVIPAGSFEGSQKAGYTFEGKIGGVALRAALTPQSPIDYSFQVEGAGVPALPDKLPVRLMVGAAAGRTMVKPDRP
jgi:hypothetical protein